MIARYSRPEMVALWTDEARFEFWLEIETLALEKMVDEGIAPKEALCLLYTSPSPRDRTRSRMPSSA